MEPLTFQLQEFFQNLGGRHCDYILTPKQSKNRPNILIPETDKIHRPQEDTTEELVHEVQLR